MLTRTVRGELREVWVETNPADFDGRTDFWLTTDIPLTEHNDGRPEIDFVEVYLYVDTVEGSPVIPDPEVRRAPHPAGAPEGRLEVRIRNTAPPGNRATYTLDVRLNHSVVR